MKIDIIRTAAAVSAIEDAKFRQRWKRLWDNCLWATGSQHPRFVRCWYRAYQSVYEPLLVTGGEEELLGLLPLAVSRSQGTLTYAGTHHAEYQVWLSEPAQGNEFILGALRALAVEYPNDSLRFLFVPPGVPLGWLESPDWKRRHLIRPHPRPLLDLTVSDGPEASLRKKGNKSRIKRLQKISPLRFERLRTRAELECVLDSIIDQCDLRQGAMYDVLPFRNDPLKRAFYLSLMEEPELLHATVLRLGAEVIASHLGICNRHSVSLGVLTHSPCHARNSPGKILLLMLAAYLGREGFRYFDLTPGGDYKERFANFRDVAYTLDIYFSSSAARRRRLQHRLRETLKTLLRVCRLNGAALRGRLQATLRWAAKLRLKHAPRRVMRRLTRLISWTREYRMYRYPAPRARELADTQGVHRDSICDLLSYETLSWEGTARKEFLRTCLARLENGAHAYTASEGGALLHASWLWERESISQPDRGHRIQLPPNSAVLWDDYTDPRARGRGLHRLAIQKRMRDAAFVPGTEWLFIGVFSDNHRSRKNIERMGFEHYASFFTSVRLGRTRRWVVLTPDAERDARLLSASSASDPGRSGVCVSQDT